MIDFKKFKFEKSDRDSVYCVAAVLSFVIPVAIMLSIFIIKEIYPFGDRSFLFSDMYHQYLPFFAEFIRKVKAGEGLSYSYNVGIGSNFLALYVYYLASPLNWLGFLVPESHLIEFLSYLTVFRIGMCGFTAFYYLNHHFVEKRPEALFFACFYALSGFTAAYNYNVMWIDCVVVLPILLLGLERLVKEGRCGMYCLSLAYCILTNYYISIMVCIFLVLYFITLLVTEKRSPKILFHFAFYSLLAGGMASALLIPEVCAILETDFGDMVFPTKLERYFSVLDELARHCLAVYTERGLEHWPNIYCGTAVFVLIPMYLTNNRISIRKRFCNMVLLGIFLFSFATNMADYVWHGLNYPDSLPARQSFLYIFLVIVLCYEAYLKMDRMPKNHILYCFLAGVAFLLFCEKFVDNPDFETDIVFLTILFLSVFTVLLYLKRTKKDPLTMQALVFSALVAVVAEGSINTYNTSVGTVSRTQYLEDQEDYAALYEYTRNGGEKISSDKNESPAVDGGAQTIYRIEKFTRKTKNDGTLTGYPTASVFSSTLNSQVMDLYKALGLRNSKVFYGYDGATPFVAALFNVDWMFGKEKDYSNFLYGKETKSGEIMLYRVNHRLPFGYVAPTGFQLPENEFSIRLQNQMARDLGITGRLFEVAAEKNVGDDSLVTAKKNGVHYAVISASGTGKVRVLGGSLEEVEYNDLKKDCIIYLGYLYEGDTVTIKNADENDATPKISVDAYSLNEDVLGAVLDKLGETHLVNVSADTTHLSGEVAMKEEGRLILSIPYEKGWRITLDGEKTVPELFGNALIAFDLPAGVHHIEMHYVPFGFWPGVVTSIASVMVFLFVCLLSHGKGRRVF